MIQISSAKNGSFILSKDGKFLASTFDPQKEAETWWKNCQSLTKCTDTILVLGLGCGYHIASILRDRPNARVIVIEPDQRVIEAVKSQTKEFDQLEIVNISDWRKLYTHSSLVQAVAKNYSVTVHTPSSSADPEYFQNAYKYLLARDVEGFFALLRQRPEILKDLDEAKLGELARSSEPVTIKTLSRLVKPSTFANENRRLWKVLEELIA